MKSLPHDHAVSMTSTDIAAHQSVCHASARGNMLSTSMICFTPAGPCMHVEPSVLAADAWVLTHAHMQGLRWNEDPVGEHMFPRLRLAVRPNLVQLAGGMTNLPVTNPQVNTHHMLPLIGLLWASQAIWLVHILHNMSTTCQCRSNACSTCTRKHVSCRYTIVSSCCLASGI